MNRESVINKRRQMIQRQTANATTTLVSNMFEKVYTVNAESKLATHSLYDSASKECENGHTFDLDRIWLYQQLFVTQSIFN